jgi:hypothetical protein
MQKKVVSTVCASRVLVGFLRFVNNTKVATSLTPSAYMATFCLAELPFALTRPLSDPTKLRFITRGEFMQRIKKDQPRSMTVSEADKLKMFLGACLKIQKKVNIKYRTDVGVCKRFSSLPYDIGLPVHYLRDGVHPS